MPIFSADSMFKKRILQDTFDWLSRERRETWLWTWWSIARDRWGWDCRLSSERRLRPRIVRRRSWRSKRGREQLWRRTVSSNQSERKPIGGWWVTGRELGDYRRDKRRIPRRWYSLPVDSRTQIRISDFSAYYPIVWDRVSIERSDVECTLVPSSQASTTNGSESMRWERIWILPMGLRSKKLMGQRIGRQNILNGMKSFKVRCVSIRLPSCAEFVHCSDRWNWRSWFSETWLWKRHRIDGLADRSTPFHPSNVFGEFRLPNLWSNCSTDDSDAFRQHSIQPTNDWRERMLLPDSGDPRAIEGHPRREGCPPWHNPGRHQSLRCLPFSLTPICVH